jgi:hypothetical protein
VSFACSEINLEPFPMNKDGPSINVKFLKMRRKNENEIYLGNSIPKTISIIKWD